MAAISLALAASLAWGLADFFGGLKSRRLALLTVLAVSQAAGLTAVALTVGARGAGPPDGAFWVWAALGGIAGALGLAAFYRGLAVGVMSIVAPISATAAVIPVAVGVATGERPSAVQMVGAALAIAGVALASREGVDEGDPHLAAGAEPGNTAAAAGGRRAAVPLALLAALGFGGFFVGLDAASDAGDVLWAMLVARIASGSMLIGAALVVRAPVTRSPREVAALVGIGLLDVAANLGFAAASTLGLVSIVGVLSSLYPVVTIFLARAFLHERIDRAQEVGVAGALAGVALIAAG